MASKYASRELYGEVVEGPGGNVMPEAVARMIDVAMKKLPAECRQMGYKRVAALPAGMEIKDGERADISLVTNDAVDRDHEVMIPGGGDWGEFKKNPVVTFAHRYDELPVGRGLWVKRAQDGNGWMAKTSYTTKPEGWQGDWFPDAVWHMVKLGDLRGKSIGFIPTEMSAPMEKEIAARPELAGVGMVIRKWTVLEYAVAPVQSNPDAYVVAVGKAAAEGIIIPDCIMEEAGIYVPMAMPTLSYKQVAEPEQKVMDRIDIPDTLDTEEEDDEPDMEVIQRVIQSVDVKSIIKEQLDLMRGRV